MDNINWGDSGEVAGDEVPQRVGHLSTECAGKEVISGVRHSFSVETAAGHDLSYSC